MDTSHIILGLPEIKEIESTKNFLAPNKKILVDPTEIQFSVNVKKSSQCVYVCTQKDHFFILLEIRNKPQTIRNHKNISAGKMSPSILLASFNFFKTHCELACTKFSRCISKILTAYRIIKSWIRLHG